MSLKIGVPDVDYTSGSPVTGTVSLVGDADIDIETISIKFIGRANTFVEYLTGDLPASDAPDPQVHESQFFTYETVLFQGPETLHAPQSWPFSFVFPSKALPSSFSDRGIQWRTQSTCSITYWLKAYLLSPSNGEHHHFHSNSSPIKLIEKELSFTAARSVESSDPKMLVKSHKLTLESLHLLPSIQNRHLTIGEEFQSVFHHGQLPKEAFILSLEMPSVAVTGKLLPLVLNLQHDTEVERTSALLESPPIVLKTIKVEILINTDVMSTGNLQGGWVDIKVLASTEYPKGAEDA